jgi:hypothetical protein
MEHKRTSLVAIEAHRKISRRLCSPPDLDVVYRAEMCVSFVCLLEMIDVLTNCLAPLVYEASSFIIEAIMKGIIIQC